MNPAKPVGKNPPRSHMWANDAAGAPAIGGWKAVNAR